jgi:hypothetical protein
VLIALDLYGTYYDNRDIVIFSTPTLDISLLIFYFLNRQTAIWQKRDYWVIALLCFNLLANIGYIFKANKAIHLLAMLMSMGMFISFLVLLWMERDRIGKIKIGKDLLTLMPLILIFLFGFVLLVLPFIPFYVRIIEVIGIVFIMSTIIISISRNTNSTSYYLILISLLLHAASGFISTFGMYLTVIPHRDIYPRFCTAVAMFCLTNGILLSFRPKPHTKSQSGGGLFDPFRHESDDDNSYPEQR